MKKIILVSLLFLTPFAMRAQNNPKSAAPDPSGALPEPVIAQSQSETIPPPPQVIQRRVITNGGPGNMTYMTTGGTGMGLGAWWKNSEIVSKLQLSDEQVKKISQTFLDHKLKLIDLQADLEKQELRLQPLMDVDQPDQSRVGAQIDLITSARGRLEKENAMMMLDIRRFLSVAQWKKLQSLEPPEPSTRGVFLFRGGPGTNTEGPPPPPLPEDMPVIRQK